MIVKVCGIKTEQNIRDIAKLHIDMIGLNFYRPSVRYVDESVDPLLYDMLDDPVSRVGVFVNMEIDDLLDYVDEYRLDFAQLHGDEDVDYCRALSKQIPVIKVFRIAEGFEITEVLAFDFVNFVLFDKDSKNYGGSGQKFEWDILKEYPLSVPFLLSGGIGPDDVDLVKSMVHPHFVGIDINSKFESEPGVKDIDMVRRFLEEVNL